MRLTYEGRRRWEKFEGYAGRGSQPYASLNKYGHLYINSAGFELAGEPERIVWLYDGQSGEIAFRPAGDQERYSYKVSRTKDGGYRTSMRAFAAERGMLQGRTIGFDLADAGDGVVALKRRG